MGKVGLVGMVVVGLVGGWVVLGWGGVWWWLGGDVYWGWEGGVGGLSRQIGSIAFICHPEKEKKEKSDSLSKDEASSAILFRYLSSMSFCI